MGPYPRTFPSSPKPGRSCLLGSLSSSSFIPIYVCDASRHNGQNYLFALLTGYCDRAAGLPPMKEGAYYNPYFPGGQIGMPPPLMDEAVEFPDGTPATVSQMAKDVVTFLSWAAEPEMEERKVMRPHVNITLLLFYV